MTMPPKSLGVFALLTVALLAPACARTGPPPQSATATEGGRAQSLLEAGRRYAANGQSVRAEQYFIAARAEGADPELVFSQLLATCIESGRFGSALHHVAQELKQHPDNHYLLRLAISLNHALGHERQALLRVDRLTEFENLSPDEELFIAEFYDSTSTRPDEAIRYYESYLVRTTPSSQAPWAREELRALRARLAQRVATLSQEQSRDDE